MDGVLTIHVGTEIAGEKGERMCSIDFISRSYRLRR